MALPIYGSQWTQHVLIAPRSVLFLFLLCLVPSVCYSQESALLSSIMELIEPGSETNNDAWQYQFPRDHHVHATHTSELWQMVAVLESTAGSAMAANIRFVRIKLNSASGAKPEESAWSFEQLFGVSAAMVDLTQEQLWSVTQMSRSALNLAGSDAMSGKTWVNQFSLHLALQAECQLSADLSAPIETVPLSLSLRSHSCPLVPEPSAFVHGYSLPLQFESGQAGSLKFTSGTAWMIRNWGELDAGQSPVVLDRFILVLEDTLLQVTRIRRRDGSGEPVLSATLHSAGRQQEVDHRALSLVDTRQWVSQTSDNRFSAGWRLNWPGHSANIEPVLPEQELNFIGQTQWSGAIRVTLETEGDNSAGTREYIGFADLSPLASQSVP